MIHDKFTDYWSGLVARYRAGPLPGFLKWWGGELAALIPESVRRRMMPPRPVLWLLPENEAGDIAIWAGGAEPERRDRFAASENADLLRDRWMGLLEGFEDGSPEIRLCLPDDEVLQSPVELPLAVESNLEQALGYQLDQVTPFRADQVYFDFGIIGRDSDHGRLQLDLRLVPVAQVDRVLQRLGAIGIRPHAIDIVAIDDAGVPRAQGFNLLPEPERPRYVYARARLNWVLAGGVVAALAVVMALSLIVRERSADRMEHQVAQLRAGAEVVMDLQQQLEDSLMAANFLAERRRRQPVMMQVLDEVTRILPDDIWLQQLQVRGNDLLMQGLADGSQRLIELINDSELLADAEFRGSVNVDPATGRERFNTRATINTRRTANAAAPESGE